MKVTILGCGGSSGTPAVGYGWGKCDPENPRNRRLRPSILVEEGDTALLVDTSPDLRQQLLNADVSRLDAVLLTHFHADHMNGIDDLRPINRVMDGPLDYYADAVTMASTEERFGYVFEPMAEDATTYYKPTLIPHILAPGQKFRVGSIDIEVFDQDHGFCRTLGFRFGPIAYSTDVVELPEESFTAVEGVEAWIIGTLADSPHPTHAHVDKALEWIDRIKPGRAVLTHLSPLFDYQTLRDRLPDGVEPAYDGMVIVA
ncbi:MAG: MBL fold metallo-hydrolase [Rhodospirillaceae bacterium]|nr:MBL fold metallo-hydrolase [Rhodospirillaceae bacterium]